MIQELAEQDPAVTGNSISLNYIQDNTSFVLVITVMTDTGTMVDRQGVTDPSMRLMFVNLTKPVVWQTQAQFDNWYELYRSINSSGEYAQYPEET